MLGGLWGALASGAAQGAFAKQGLASRPGRQSGTNARSRRRSGALQRLWPWHRLPPPARGSTDNRRLCIFLPVLHPEEGLRASPALPAAVTWHVGIAVLQGGWTGLGIAHLLCFLFNGANYPCKHPPKREKGGVGPLAADSSLACPGVAAAGSCLHPDFLVLYTVDVEQHFSLCFSRPVPLYSLQFLLLGSPHPFLNDV